MNGNIQNFLWTANSKENLISDTPGYCVSKTKGYSCSSCENLTFLPVLPTQLQRGWQERQCHQLVTGRELRICDSLIPCPVLLLWVCLGYRCSSLQQGPCSLQIPRDLWEIVGFPCPAEELGDNSLLTALKLCLIPLHGKNTSTSTASSGFCLQDNPRSLGIYFQSCQLYLK